MRRAFLFFAVLLLAVGTVHAQHTVLVRLTASAAEQLAQRLGTVSVSDPQRYRVDYAQNGGQKALQLSSALDVRALKPLAVQHSLLFPQLRKFPFPHTFASRSADLQVAEEKLTRWFRFSYEADLDIH